jgi:hypothetical protein
MMPGKPGHARLSEVTMQTTTATLPLPTLSSEVLAVAVKEGGAPYLHVLLPIVRRLFPHSQIEVEVNEDPELSYNTQIVFHVDTTGMSSDEIHARSSEWIDELLANCPKSHINLFALSTYGKS